jgi:SAM-dependent methyltransferase
LSSVEFWTEHQVGGPYHTLAESEAALEQRARLYPNLTELMPVDFPDQKILDYGCGPGHDTILFCQHGAEHVFYQDISPLALKTTRARLRMHGITQQASSRRPFQVDHIHCAGVLHHTEFPFAILNEFRMLLNPGGYASVMVYDGDRSVHSQSEVPITIWWTETDFVGLCADANFDADYVGGYDCSAEWRPDCQAACYRLTPC